MGLHGSFGVPGNFIWVLIEMLAARGSRPHRANKYKICTILNQYHTYQYTSSSLYFDKYSGV